MARVRPFFGPLMMVTQNWHDEIFLFFGHPVTNAQNESANNSVRAMPLQVAFWIPISQGS